MHIIPVGIACSIWTTRCVSKTTHLGFHILLTTCLAALNSYIYATFVDSKALLSKSSGSVLLKLQIESELAYYIAYGVLEVIDRNVLLTVHHIVASSLILFAYSFGYYQIISLFLFLFTVSNPPLALARYARHTKRNQLATISFCLFAVLFFVFRICMVALMLKTTLTTSITKIEPELYVVGNGILVTLYGMQLYWFFKIVGILLEKLSFLFDIVYCI